MAASNPELVYARENVLGQGTVPGSNVGQREGYLILHMWDMVFSVLVAPLVRADRAACPAPSLQPSPALAPVVNNNAEDSE